MCLRKKEPRLRVTAIFQLNKGPLGWRNIKTVGGLALLGLRKQMMTLEPIYDTSREPAYKYKTLELILCHASQVETFTLLVDFVRALVWHAARLRHPLEQQAAILSPSEYRARLSLFLTAFQRRTWKEPERLVRKSRLSVSPHVLAELEPQHPHGAAVLFQGVCRTLQLPPNPDRKSTNRPRELQQSHYSSAPSRNVDHLCCSRFELLHPRPIRSSDRPTTGALEPSQHWEPLCSCSDRCSLHPTVGAPEPPVGSLPTVAQFDSTNFTAERPTKDGKLKDESTKKQYSQNPQMIARQPPRVLMDR
ncbi:hypothetical protein T265_11025 [Opisthorchis viverrini]|uniref:Uncharacterized protein n=1 Tax=Opisthorchis viverrini TaxID=6198 RepID=A0A074Z0G0_OPIVI|nr:hypothetical protein T265_11025 [Opisthorchis viverrini]KER20423.1 hypothetical protein T265_11025 [Opisthorchis viverrini]